MDEFLSLKDDDKVEDEEGAVRMREEARTRESEEMGADARGETVDHRVEAGDEEVLLVILPEVSPTRDLEMLRLALPEAVKGSPALLPIPRQSWPWRQIKHLK